MDLRPIGVFDSGLGGLTSVKELIRLLPGEDIVYFGDTGRVPYGTRGRETITRYAREDAAFLLRHGVKAVVCACGTVSTVAGELLSAQMDCPFFMVVEPAAKAAAAATKNGKIGVIGTNATIRSGKFQEALRRLAGEAEVFAAPCPLFVPLVEAGHVDPDDPITNAAAAHYLSFFAEKEIDTLVLGCTHYPILTPVIRRMFGEGVTFIDSGLVAAGEVARVLEKRGMLSGRQTGNVTYYVTDDPDGFSQVAGIFLGTEVRERAIQVAIGDLESPAPGKGMVTT